MNYKNNKRYLFKFQLNIDYAYLILHKNKHDNLKNFVLE